MKIYLVGGAVRDQVRGHEPVDLDFVAVGGDERELRRRVPGLTRVGQGIPVFVRGSSQYTLSDFSSIEDDLCSRDLTINALARDESGEIVAHPRALSDLREKILRPVAPANFLADPLRAIRAARFAAAFPDFTVHAQLVEAMRGVTVDALGQVAAERVGQEVLKACAASAPGNFLRVLQAGDKLAPWLVEFRDAHAIPAGPPRFHDASVLEHTARVMDRCAGDGLGVWMALCHDLGKTVTAPELLPHHHGHEAIGPDMAQSLARRLRLPNRHGAAGSLAARWHMAAGCYDGLKPSTRVRLLLALDKAGIMESFFRMVAADQGGEQLERARRELDLITSVRLPEKHRNLGPKSAEILLMMRCEALSAGS
ncbi:tRNA nucleotidyltransferase [Desulfomicrobium sp. ZS1]|uniref:tRNA nucleotidyltransferase n=1 Tax=Desulfomicrobium sp. ZS1 TaxID=2952228 RepID=UPI0020B342B5|nr:tRNA nucleotidyltransferase [Desulfomicrobium sp. ZS1]UTF50949.1 tRNA nucleotidyltransferase [Desulfomicrobium sp. ZS1]